METREVLHYRKPSNPETVCEDIAHSPQVGHDWNGKKLSLFQCELHLLRIGSVKISDTGRYRGSGL